MSSECIVPVVEITNIREHPGASLLSIAEVLGYQVVNGLVEDPDGSLVRTFIAGKRDERGRRVPAPPAQDGADIPTEEVRYSFRYKERERGVYFPADTILTDEWAKTFEVDHLLKSDNRVGRCRIRGEASFGLVVGIPEGQNWELGQNVADFFDAENWKPDPNKATAPDAAPYDSEIDPHFRKYTDIQNGLLLYDKFHEGEEVVATEKIHGCVQARTRVSLVTGERRKISAISEGDEVLGVDGSGRVVPATVTKKWNNGKTDEWYRVTGNRRRAGRGSSFFSIYCTGQHRFWNPKRENYTRARDLQVGDVVTNLRSDLGLTPLQTQVLLGKLLGDGCLASNGISAHVSWSHREVDDDYNSWTARALGDIVSASSDYRTSGYGSSMVARRTTNSAWILDRFGSFYPYNGDKKVVPTWVTDALSPISLAFWYMDDGSLGDNRDGSYEKAHFAVCGFTRSDCEVLIAGLRRLGISTEYYQSEDYSRLRLNTDDAERLFLLVAPYIPPVMQHKLPERYRGHPGWLPSDYERIYKPMLVEQTITQIERVPASASGYTVKHDIATTTGNYFANGVLVHNSNCRVGYVNDTVCVGSRTTRKDPEREREKSVFWPVIERPEVKALLDAMKETSAKTVILFGEIYGQGVQSLHYGCNKKKGFRAFDVYVDGEFLDFHGFADLCDLHGVERVPVLYQGPFDLEKIKEVSVGKSVLPGAKNIREGVVVRTAKERRDPALGRVVLKFVSPQYDLSKHKKKDTTDV